MKTSLIQTALVGAMSLCLANLAQAENFSKAAFEGAKDDIKTTYKAERETCNSQAGNAKDICVEKAKAREKIALAQLQYNYTGNNKDEVNLYQARYEAYYDIAKEKCDDLSGNAKDLCVREAKTNRDQSKADVNFAKKVYKAFDEADAEHLKADQKLATEKCNALAGDQKDACNASVKARFNEQW